MIRRSRRTSAASRKVLVVDIGGTNLKIALAGSRRVVKVPSGKDLTPQAMVSRVKSATLGWQYDVVSIGYPGPVKDGKPVKEPVNIGPGWTRFDFTKAFGKPVRIVNDAAMQAIGSYRGKRMLFLGLGTGLGTTIIDYGHLEPLELGHLPYLNGQSFEDHVGTRGMKRLGRKRWEAHVHAVVEILRNAMLCDYVVLGGGNVKQLTSMPAHCRCGNNALAFRGGGLLWTNTTDAGATPKAKRR